MSGGCCMGLSAADTPTSPLQDQVRLPFIWKGLGLHRQVRRSRLSRCCYNFKAVQSTVALIALDFLRISIVYDIYTDINADTQVHMLSGSIKLLNQIPNTNTVFHMSQYLL